MHQESTTNSLTSGFFEDGAGNDQTSPDNNEALSLLLRFQTFFAKSHASLRAHRSCCKVSCCVLSKFGAHRLRS